MGSLERHQSQYRSFKAAADLTGTEPQARVELLFLAAYHLIDACAAKKGQHINKHQLVRHELERNPSIFGERTDSVRKAFDELQGTIRIKFVYSGRWKEEDSREAERLFALIESTCREVLSDEPAED